MDKLTFEGLAAAPFAPMKPNGDINLDIIPDYASFFAHNSILGVYVNGTTGEGNYSLTMEERMALTEAWLQQKSKVPCVMVQVGGCPFKEALLLAAHAEKNGASAIGILPNVFNKPTSVDCLVEWVARIAEAAPNTPSLYYHLPKLTDVDLPLDQFLKKGSQKIPTLAGMKFSCRDLAAAGKCMILKRPDGKPYKMYFGSDETYLAHYTFGLESAIGSSYNFAPKLFLDINDAINNRNIEKARQLQDQVTLLFDVLFKRNSPGVVPQKAAMKILTGLDMGPPRFPLKPLSIQEEKELAKDLAILEAEKFHV